MLRHVFRIILVVLLATPYMSYAAAPDQHWPKHGHSAHEQRYSPLKEIHTKNVQKLGMVWKFPLNSKRGVEATPIEVDGVVYTTAPWARVFALDAKTGKLLWQYNPRVAGKKGRDACCGVVNRGVAVWQNLVIFATLDGRLMALDKNNGEVRWSVQTTDNSKPYTITGAPRIAKGKVFIGNGGAEFGVRGYFSAYDALTGAQLWRFYTVPRHPDFPKEHPELEMAAKTWSEQSLWQTGLGGTVWDSFAYDAELNLLYVGVGNSSQYNRAVRSPGGGDNLFLASILAINPDTGRLVWHYQTTPGESWDYTATQHMILAELDILGQHRKVLMQAPKNGFFYVLDRETGELLSAKNYLAVNWASHINLESGRPVETGLADWGSETRYVLPSVLGGHNWHPMSFNPDTGLVYIPTLHQVHPFYPKKDFEYNPNTFNTGEDWASLSKELPPVNIPICSPTRLTAWDPVAQELRWQVSFSRGVPAGTLTTAGGLVFQGTSDGKLAAYSAKTGTLLWSQRTGTGIMAPPISYRLDGEQYVLVAAGLGGASGTHGDVLDNTNAGYMFAFKLGGTETAPQMKSIPREVHVTDSGIDAAAQERGSALYATHCLRCHGLGARASGVIPDLRFASDAVHQAWNDIVLNGIYQGGGMAGFANVLNERDANDIHSFVIGEALRSQSLATRLMQSVADQVCIPATWLAE